MIVVPVGTPEHEGVVRRMADELQRDRAAFYSRYGRYLPPDDTDDTDMTNEEFEQAFEEEQSA